MCACFVVFAFDAAWYTSIVTVMYEPPMYIECDELLTIEHILLACSDLIEIRESHSTAQSLCVLFQEISPEKVFNFLKEINILGFFKLEITFGYVCVFEYGFKIVHIYQF